MARIAGVKLHKTSSGKLKAVTFDLKKHGDIINPYLKKIGAVETKSIEDEEAEFDKEFNEGITGDELLKRVFKHIDTLPWKK